jgi:hypothetical protein
MTQEASAEDDSREYEQDECCCEDPGDDGVRRHCERQERSDVRKDVKKEKDR